MTSRSTRPPSMCAIRLPRTTISTTATTSTCTRRAATTSPSSGWASTPIWAQPTPTARSPAATTTTLSRASKPLTDRADISVGPVRIEVIEPLRKLRVIVEPGRPADSQLAMDVTWTSPVDPFEEPRQFLRVRGTVVFNTQRFAQLGRWEGTLTVDGTDIAVTPDRCGGARDRSWGVRPVGEKQPDGIRQTISTLAGMWNYMPADYGDHWVIYLCHEEPDGNRTMQTGMRVWTDPDRPRDVLGRPEWVHDTIGGTRLLAGVPHHVPRSARRAHHRARRAAGHQLHLHRRGLRRRARLASRHVAGRGAGGAGPFVQGQRDPGPGPVRGGGLGGPPSPTTTPSAVPRRATASTSTASSAPSPSWDSPTGATCFRRLPRSVRRTVRDLRPLRPMSSHSSLRGGWRLAGIRAG